MSQAWLRAGGRFGRRIGSTLLWTVLLLATAIAINLIGIRLLGGITDWERWMNEHAGHFLAWRMLLYAGTIGGWMWLHRRLLTREPDTATRRHLLRTEIGAVLALAALEISTLLQSR